MKSFAARCHHVSKNRCHGQQWLHYKSHKVKWQASVFLQGMSRTFFFFVLFHLAILIFFFFTTTISLIFSVSKPACVVSLLIGRKTDVSVCFCLSMTLIGPQNWEKPDHYVPWHHHLRGRAICTHYTVEAPHAHVYWWIEDLKDSTWVPC